MKKITRFVVFACVGLIALVPALSHAAELKTAREYTLQKGDTVGSDLYIAAQTNVVAGEVKGDLAVAGANTLITGSIGSDLLAVGGMVDVLGDIGDDVRAAGGTITIGKNVGGDVVVAGGTVHIISGATVAGDVIAAGGQVIIDGTVKGNVKVAGGEVTINGMVGKDVSVRSDKQFSIGSNSSIGGTTWYKSPTEAVIAEGAVLKSAPQFEKMEQPARLNERMSSSIAGLIGVMALLQLLVMLVTVIGMTVLFKKTAQSLVKRALSHFGPELVRGFVLLVVGPVAIVVALVSVVGIGFAVAGALVYIALLFAAKIIAAIMLGAIIMKLIKKTADYEIDWKSAAIGVIGVELIALVPIIGWVAVFLLFLASLGSASLMLYQKAWLKR